VYSSRWETSFREKNYFPYRQGKQLFLKPRAFIHSTKQANPEKDLILTKQIKTTNIS